MYSIQFMNLSSTPCLGCRRSHLCTMPAVIHLHQMTVATCTDHISHVWDFPGWHIWEGRVRLQSSSFFPWKNLCITFCPPSLLILFYFYVFDLLKEVQWQSRHPKDITYKETTTLEKNLLHSGGMLLRAGILWIPKQCISWLSLPYTQWQFVSEALWWMQHGCLAFFQLCLNWAYCQQVVPVNH